MRARWFWSYRLKLNIGTGRKLDRRLEAVLETVGVCIESTNSFSMAPSSLIELIAERSKRNDKQPLTHIEHRYRIRPGYPHIVTLATRVGMKLRNIVDLKVLRCTRRVEKPAHRTL